MVKKYHLERSPGFLLASETSKIAKYVTSLTVHSVHLYSCVYTGSVIVELFNKNSFCLERPCSKDLVQIGYIWMKTNLCWNLFVVDFSSFFLSKKTRQSWIMSSMCEIFWKRLFFRQNLINNPRMSWHTDNEIHGQTIHPMERFIS